MQYIEEINRFTNNLSSYLIETIDQIIYKIKNCKGNIILIGNGKSYHIAHKFSDSLKSISYNSFCLNADLLLHGDIGTIKDNDFILFISKSSKVNQIILDCINNEQYLVLGFGSKEKNYIQLSDLKIEGSDINKLPLLSSTLTLIFLDMVIINLISNKKISNLNFINNHKGGSVGLFYRKKIKEFVLPLNLIPICYINSTSKEVISEMNNKKKGYVLIKDNETNEYLGIITDGDLRRNMQEYKVKNIYNSKPITVDINSTVREVIDLDNNKKLGNYPVVENNKIAGYVEVKSFM